MYVILVYDIKMDITGPKVLRKTFKTCKRYLTHIQNSVFEGHITQAQKYELQKELEKLIRKDKDSLIVFTAPYEKILKREFWGMEDDPVSNIL